MEALEVRDDTIVMRLAAREGATGRPEEVLDLLGIAFEETRIERTHLLYKGVSSNIPDREQVVAYGGFPQDL